MPLITTIPELRNQLPRLLSSLNDIANLPNIAKAQRKYLKPIMGTALLADLQTKYTAATLTGDEAELLSILQVPLASFAILDDLAFNQTTYTDNGNRSTGTDSMPAAHRWEYLELKNTLQNYAIEGINDLLDYLYENKLAYPLWTASNEYKDLSSLLIITGKDFSKQYPLFAANYTFWFLKPIMADVEENYFVGFLGRDLFNWVKSQDAIEITAEGGLLDVKKLFKKAFAFLTVKHSCEHATPRFDQNGFTVLSSGNADDNSNTGFTAASAAAIESKKQVCDRDGQNYLLKAAHYLVGISKNLFPEDFGVDFTDAFTVSPLNLSPDDAPWTNGNEKYKFFRF